MSMTGTVPFKLYRPLALGASGSGVNAETLAGTKTMTYSDEQLEALDPDGVSRNVVLPPADLEHKGVFYAIYNSGNNVNNLVVKDVAATILTLADGESGMVACDGTNWKVVMAMPATTALLGAANTWTGTNDFGVDGTGVDVTLFGDTATRKVVWDQSEDTLRAQDNTKIGWGSGAGTTPDIAVAWDATRLNVTQLTVNSEIRWGIDGAGIDQMWYGDTASTFMTWDQSADSLIFADNGKVVFGTGSDITIYWDATNLKITQAAPNSAIDLGADGAGIDIICRGDTAGAAATWDQSADTLVFTGVAKVQGAVVKTNGATAITTTRAVTRADSGGVFTVDQGSAYTITVAQPAEAGERYLFQCVAPAAFDVSIVATGCTFEGTIINDVTSVVPATGATLKFATGAAVLGDTIELIATSTTKFLVRAVTSAAGGITIA